MAMTNRNEEFLSVIDSATKAAILKSIAEVADADAEHLQDYMVEPQRTATSLLMQRHGMRNW